MDLGRLPSRREEVLVEPLQCSAIPGGHEWGPETAQAETRRLDEG
jgi:hypothetical protein